jgi:hypothetical protein
MNRLRESRVKSLQEEFELIKTMGETEIEAGFHLPCPTRILNIIQTISSK